MEEGKLIEWRVSEGDSIAQGDIVAEIETDKANMEVEALGGGVLRRIVVQAGQTVPVGALIGVIGEPDESIDDIIAKALAEAGDASAAASATSPSETAPSKTEPEAPAAPPEPPPQAPPAEAAFVDAAPVETAPVEAAHVDSSEGRGPAGRVKASPVARRMAAEGGLDLGSVAGSGPGGRIVKSDIEAAMAAGAAASGGPESVTRSPAVPAPSTLPAPATTSAADGHAVVPPAAAAPLPPPRLDARVEEASQMRKAIARGLAKSIGPVPHFFLTSEIDMGRALELRADINARMSDGKIGVNDLLIKATAEALARHPAVNSSWEDGSVRYHGGADIGIAVALDGGLIVPVLRDAERKGLRQISIEARDLIGRARSGKLDPEEYQGATFSVSNLGMFEIDDFTAIINPPESGILAIGRTTEKPVVVEGEVVVRKRMRVTMSCDHRVVDGALGAAFLGTFKAMLENPLEMIL